MAKKRNSEADDMLSEARKEFARIEEAEADNRKTYLEDYRFARDGQQWPDKIVSQREAEGRPVLTINKMTAFIRQVVNDARQNKPSIKVHPADSGADPEVAEVYNGLIRNIEYSSHADVAYDTATECAVTGGFGYLRIGLDYAYDDSFDLDITIKRVANPLSVYGDPNSGEAGSLDWDVSFVVDKLSTAQFETQYGDKAQAVDWDDAAWTGAGESWRTENSVLVAEWWSREKVDKPIVQLSDGTILDKKEFEAKMKADAMFAVAVQNGLIEVKGERIAKSCTVKQRIMTGAEILSEREWPGRYIPIVPVYGDEFNIEGKRYFRSLIHPAKDAQRMFNYWRTTATELVALAPRVPWVGEEGAFDVDAGWNTANTQSHSFLQHKRGTQMPQRLPLGGEVAAGALQEALNAADDIKSTIGMFDASLGAKSNETSGKAIMARQREGDVATFHFLDNMARAIRNTGQILIDLIPKVYTNDRIIRTIGEDGKEKTVPLNRETPVTDKKGQPVPQMGPDGQPIMDPQTGKPLPLTRIYDLSAGKYDLTVTTGPSFTTRREEAAYSMTEALRAFPDAAPVIVPELAKNLDWPGADEIAEKLEQMGKPQIPPEMQKAIEQGKQQIAQLTEENQNLKMQHQSDAAKVASAERVKMLEIAADERIAVAKAQSDARVKRQVAIIQAQATIEIAAARPEPQPAARG
jgi:hypothetical protein